MTQTQAAFARALDLHRKGRLAEALAGYDQVLSRDAGHAQAMANGANVLRLMGRMDEALARYDRAVALKVDPVTLYNRGAAREALGQWPDAAADYKLAVALKPDFPEALNNLGNVLNALRRPHEALAFLDRAVAARPDNAEALVNRGNVRRDLLQWDGALADYDAALALKPDLAAAFGNRGVLRRDRMQFEDAEADFRTAMALSPPGYCDAAFHLGATQLLRGAWDEGWQGYDQRLLRDTYIRRGFEKLAPVWNGEDLACKRLLLWTEQGYGDMIQFIRFAPRLGGDITLVAPRRMHRLLAGAAPQLRFIESVQGGEYFDYQIALMSLPRVLKITPDTVPAATPYLHADPRLAALWKERLPPGFKVGLVWQGSPKGSVDKGRSLPFAALLPLTHIDGVTCISLQKGFGLEQLPEKLPGNVAVPLPDFDEGAEAFADTAAILTHLDLVITPDTAIAHLAGALARPVWLMLQHVPDWRWLLGRSDSVWYPQMRLYRQGAPGDWGSVVAAMVKDLQQQAGSWPSAAQSC